MSYFGPGARRFLKELAANNDRAWFKEHQQTYEAEIREPALRFIEDAGAWMEVEGLPFRAEAKKVGGSLSKIHRDVRFSKDKTPYNDHVIMHFKHKQADRDTVAPAVGIRFDITDAGIGGGVWGAPTPVLNRIRDRIVADPDGWMAARQSLEFTGDSLKTAPKGFDKEHPLIEDIRRKGYMATLPLTGADLTGDLLGAFQDGVRTLRPVTEYLERALF